MRCSLTGVVMKKVNAFCMFYILFVATTVFSVELPEIEVVGTSLLPGLGIESKKLPYDIKTFSGDSIGQESSIGLSDYMSQTLPGVYSNEVQGSPYQGDITYRGFRASSTLGASQGISVYIDGIRVNEPFGDVVNWDMIPEFAIDNVSLIPGSNPMYGLNTLGGAISLTTKSGLANSGINTKMSYGSFDRKKIDFSVGGKLSKEADAGEYFISFSHFDETGWRDHSAGEISSLFGKISRNTSFGSIGLMTYFGDSDLLGNGLLPSTNYGIEQSVGQTQGSGLYDDGRSSVYSHPDITRNEVGLVSLNFANYIDDNTELTGLLYHRYGRQKRIGGDVEAEFESDLGKYEFEGEFNNTKTRQNSHGLGLNLSKILGLHQITAGLTLDKSSMNYIANEIEDCELDFTRKVICSEVSESELTAKVSGKSKTYSFFASDTYEASKIFYVTTALRYNHTEVSNTLSTVDEEVQGLVTQPKEKFDYSKLNPAIGISANFKNGINFFMNASQGNRVPTVIELGCADKENPCLLPTGLQADPFLKQVVSQTFEIGVRNSFGANDFGIINIYNTDNENDIIFVSTDVNSGAGYFTNFGKTRNRGMDLLINYKINQLILTGSYSYLEATYQESGLLFGERSIQTSAGMRVAGIPKNVFRFGIDWIPIDKFKIGMALLASSDLVTQGNEDGQIGGEKNTIEKDTSVSGYTVVNVNMKFEPSKELMIFGRITNLFNSRFETYGAMAESVFNSKGDYVDNEKGPTVNKFVAPGAPRGFFVGVDYKF